MPLPSLSTSALEYSDGGIGVLFLDADGLSDLGKAIDEKASGHVSHVLETADFKGKLKEKIEIPAPPGTGMERLVLCGVASDEPLVWTDIGGTLARFAKSAKTLTLYCETNDGSLSAEDVAALGEGIKLGAYSFSKYKSKKDKDDNGDKDDSDPSVVLACSDPSATDAVLMQRLAIADGTLLARDLVNMPPNDLGPEEFAVEAEKLAELGAEVTILGEAEMAELEMRALLGVGQGSRRESKLAIIEWKGAKQDKPVCFVGKGVVFDTGGISLKPSGGMEDMKGDMGGAAAVIGLMKALAGRKAKVHAVGILGLVENMPDGNAQRPGDIVTSKSGQTIEIINTDAEGRLVLCDALTYTQERFDPKIVIDLATLTGAVMVALGQHNAGLFSNDDALSEQLVDAGHATGELVWRLPIGPKYDKMIDSKFADMKNTGGRFAGSITAAQFLHRFV
ncbi:MAG: leucyl aminopeptidase, partial [Pseudomonadota bacterium]